MPECKPDDVFVHEEEFCEAQANSADEWSGVAPGTPALTPKELGRMGECAARIFLERKGYEILETNWTCFAGEADIIALDEDVLCFVEVKTRRDPSKGFPSETITKKKRQRYEKIAACYLADYGGGDIQVRFDFIGIMALGCDRVFLKMIKNAFSVGE